MLPKKKNSNGKEKRKKSKAEKTSKPQRNENNENKLDLSRLKCNILTVKCDYVSRVRGQKKDICVF